MDIMVEQMEENTSEKAIEKQHTMRYSKSIIAEHMKMES